MSQRLLEKSLGSSSAKVTWRISACSQVFNARNFFGRPESSRTCMMLIDISFFFLRDLVCGFLISEFKKAHHLFWV